MHHVCGSAGTMQCIEMQWAAGFWGLHLHMCPTYPLQLPCKVCQPGIVCYTYRVLLTSCWVEDEVSMIELGLGRCSVFLCPCRCFCCRRFYCLCWAVCTLEPAHDR
jgi:hypothetical protein